MENIIFTYLVIFKSHAHKYEGPISLHAINNGTMHLFDEEMYSTLDAIEFLMHMPRNSFDLYDIDEHLLSASHDTSHYSNTRYASGTSALDRCNNEPPNGCLFQRIETSM